MYMRDDYCNVYYLQDLLRCEFPDMAVMCVRPRQLCSTDPARHFTVVCLSSSSEHFSPMNLDLTYPSEFCTCISSSGKHTPETFILFNMSVILFIILKFQNHTNNFKIKSWLYLILKYNEVNKFLTQKEYKIGWKWLFLTFWNA